MKSSFSERVDSVPARVPLQDAPFDLAVAATGSVFSLTLVTADAQLIECGWLKAMPNQ